MPKSKVTKTDLSEGVTRTPVKVKQTKTPVVWLTMTWAPGITSLLLAL